MRRFLYLGFLGLLAATPVLAQDGLRAPPPVVAPRTTADLPPPTPFLPTPPAPRLGQVGVQELIPIEQCTRSTSGLNCFRWKSRPGLIEARAVYPSEALAQGRSAMVTLRCAVTDLGRLNRCAVSSETPANQGFGEAALKLAEKFEMDRTTPHWSAMTGLTIVTPVWFDLGPGSQTPVRMSDPAEVRIARRQAFDRQLAGADCSIYNPSGQPLPPVSLPRIICGGISFE